MSAGCSRRRPVASWYRTPVARLPSWTISTTVAWVRSSNRPVRAASGMTVTVGADFAPVRQPGGPGCRPAPGRVGGRRAEAARRAGEGCVAEVVGRLAEDGPGVRLGQRRDGVVAGTRPFERGAPGDPLSLDVARLARDACHVLEPVVVGLQFLVRDPPVLNGHLGRDRPFTVAPDGPAADLEVAGAEPPGLTGPGDAGPADAARGREGPDPADRQRAFAGGVP